MKRELNCEHILSGIDLRRLHVKVIILCVLCYHLCHLQLVTIVCDLSSRKKKCFPSFQFRSVCVAWLEIHIWAKYVLCLWSISHLPLVVNVISNSWPWHSIHTCMAHCHGDIINLTEGRWWLGSMPLSYEVDSWYSWLK